MQVLSNQLIDNFPWIHKNKFDMETKIGFDRSQHIIKIWNSKFCELFYLFNSKKSFQKHCKVKELLKNNFYQFIVLDLKPDLIIKMLATNARPTNTRILMIFKGILRLALGGVPRKCATNVVQKSNMFLECLWPRSHVLYVVLRKVCVCIDGSNGQVSCLFFTKLYVVIYLSHFFENCVVENKIWWLLRNRIDQISGEPLCCDTQGST